MKFFFCKGTQMFDWVGRQYSCTLVPVQGKFILATWKAWHGMRTTRRHEQWETCGIQDSWAWFAPRFFFAGWQELRFVSFREIKVSWTILVQTISFVDQSRSWAAYGTRQRILFVGVLSIRFITDKSVGTTRAFTRSTVVGVLLQRFIAILMRMCTLPCSHICVRARVYDDGCEEQCLRGRMSSPPHLQSPPPCCVNLSSPINIRIRLNRHICISVYVNIHICTSWISI